MPPIEEILSQILAALPGAELEILPNPGPAKQDSLLVAPASALAVATYLRDDPTLRFDYCSNASGVDWPGTPPPQPASESSGSDDAPAATEPDTAASEPHIDTGYLEAVYHLYSMKYRHGPLVLRIRTANRTDEVEIPSLTPVWRSCDLQEREIFDLFGIRFVGHPSLSRLLMWDEFEGHPMRKDYRDPDDDDLPGMIPSMPNGKEAK